jgi:DNA-binding MarR family transcriptional regulator
MKTTTRKPSDPALDRDALVLYEALSDLVRLYQFRDRNVICCHDISVTQCYAMQTLGRGDGMSLGALAKDLMLDKSTTSRVVETLERKGYVTRQTDPNDARVLVLRLTREGNALRRRIERECIEEEKALLANVSPEVRRATIEVIHSLAGATARRMGIEGDCGCGAPGEGACEPC